MQTRRRGWMIVVAGMVVSATFGSAALGLVGPPAASGQPAVELFPKEATLSPSEATVGDDITVGSSSVGCFGASGRANVVWAVFPHGDFTWGEQLGWEPGDALASGVGVPHDTGQSIGAWRATFPAPQPGDGVPATDIGPGSPATTPVLQVYGPLTFIVDGQQLDFVAKCHEASSTVCDLVLEPEVPELGGSATVTSDDPCPMPHTRGGAVDVDLLMVAPDTPVFGEIDVRDLGSPRVADDGSWSLTFDVPDLPGYSFGLNVRCVNVEGGATQGYWLTPFDVREPGGPTIETPPGLWDDVEVDGAIEPGSAPSGAIAPPAQPVAGTPTYTG